MGNVLVESLSLKAIANAIRNKNGTQNTYKPSQMASAINDIDSGGSTPTGTISITENGTHDVSSYASANVNVPQGTTPTGTKQISITSNGTTTEDVTNYASAEITVTVPTGSTPVINPLSVTENGTYTAPSGVDGYSPITVNVSGGGSSSCALLKTVTVSGTRSAQVDLDADWESYGAIVIIPDITISANDWLYVAFNATSSNAYIDKATVLSGFPTLTISKNASGAWQITGPFRVNQYSVTLSAGFEDCYLYYYAYNSNNTLTGTIKVYGMAK